MPTLGDELKRLREQRGISLAEISEATRIGTRFLKPIETDNFSVLPGGIFTRSFIRTFAKQVGMDEEQAILKYQQQAAGVTLEAVPSIESSKQSEAPEQPSHPVKPAPPVAPSASKAAREKRSTGEKQTPKIAPKPVEEPKTKAARQASEPGKPRAYRSSSSTKPSSSSKPPQVFVNQSGPPRSWSRTVIAAAILLFVGAAVYTLVKQLNRATFDSKGTTTVVESASKNAGTSQSPKPDVTRSVSQADKSSSTAAPSTTKVEPQPSPQPSSASSSGDDKLVVKLMASSGDSWIRYQVDDSSPMTMTLRQGQTQEIPPALNQIKLNYGDRMVL